MATLFDLINYLLFFGYWLLIAAVTLRVLLKRRTVSSSMVWLMIIYILPLVGLIAYLAMGELYLGRRRAERAKSMWPATLSWIAEIRQSNTPFSREASLQAWSLFRLCEARQGLPAVKGNQLQLLTNASDVMHALIRDIDLACEKIEMVFYIWQPGGQVDDVAKSLINAANRGVYCRVMLDSAGSRQFFRSQWPNRLRDAGIELVEALKVNLWRFFLRRLDLRQHRKIVLIDNAFAYTGSMNMVDPGLFKQEAGVGQWVDLMARMEGPVATTLGMVYSCDWEIETGNRLLPPSPDRITMPFESASGHAIHVIASGPGFPEDMIHQALLTAIYAAQEELTLTTPYFVPSDDLLHAICTAALRGVKVNLIIPQKNDSLLVGWASRAFFTELLDAGVHIWQFQDDLLHSKSVLVDGILSLIGTVNLDIRSLWLNFEVTLAIDDGDFGTDLDCVHKDYIARSIQLDKAEWATRPYWRRLFERLFYFFSPLL